MGFRAARDFRAVLADCAKEFFTEFLTHYLQVGFESALVGVNDCSQILIGVRGDAGPLPRARLSATSQKLPVVVPPKRVIAVLNRLPRDLGQHFITILRKLPARVG